MVLKHSLTLLKTFSWPLRWWYKTPFPTYHLLHYAPFLVVSLLGHRFGWDYRAVCILFSLTLGKERVKDLLDIQRGWGGLVFEACLWMILSATTAAAVVMFQQHRNLCGTVIYGLGLVFFGLNLIGYEVLRDIPINGRKFSQQCQTCRYFNRKAMHQSSAAILACAVNPLNVQQQDVQDCPDFRSQDH